MIRCGAPRFGVIDNSTTHDTVGGILVTVGSMGFLANAWAGLLSGAGMGITWHGVRIETASPSRG